MKKLLAMLFLGALVSLGCNQGKQTGTVHATSKETVTVGTGHGTSSGTMTPTGKSSTSTTGGAHVTETKSGGKATVKGETKR